MDRSDTFLDASVLNSRNTVSENRLIRGKARTDTRFERTKMVAQQNKVDTGKLKYHRREFEIKIWNTLAVLTSISPDDLDYRGDATVKMIHEAVILIADRYKSEKPDKLSTGTKQVRERCR